MSYFLREISPELALELTEARQVQMKQDLLDLAKYRARKIEAYKQWSASGGQEFVTSDLKGQRMVVNRDEVMKVTKDCLPDDFEVESVRTGKQFKIKGKQCAPSSTGSWLFSLGRTFRELLSL